MWIIITEKITQHDSDERSRTHPGHGYPAYSEIIPVATMYDTYKDFSDAIERLEEAFGSPKYKAYKAEPVTVTKKLVITVN